jgi:hypothetical protein
VVVGGGELFSFSLYNHQTGEETLAEIDYHFKLYHATFKLDIASEFTGVGTEKHLYTGIVRLK